MTKSLDLSGKIEPLVVEFFQTFQQVATTTGTRFFVVGAMARDLVLEHGFGLTTGRATNDVDLGVCVPNWGAFQRLADDLLATGNFVKHRDVQRFVYRGELLVDMLPFGQIADTARTIHWPPDFDFAMSVAGFDEAFSAALHVKVRDNPPLEFLVASPAGLAIMKVVAWSERPQERNRDALDLAYLLKNYLDAGNYERLLEEHPDLVDVENFDYIKAGARLMGRDIAQVAAPDTKGKVLSILERETQEQIGYLLVRQMMSSQPLSHDDERLFAENLELLRQLMTGIRES
jgi:predicted nucleotidyltransferase